MGTCLDTEQQSESQMSEGGGGPNTGRWRGEAGLLSTPPDGHFPEQNIGPVKFEMPIVPVIFVLGGPGSGKVTHCDTLMQENENITHINMMDLLQQYALGNDMQDFGQLSSKTVTEVLMLEMKMSPKAKVYLVSGYPRNMRDVVEYAEKIKIVNGVILVSWRQEVLERQIDFGAQLGHVVIGLARMELQNFYRNVMPVVEYFDQSGMLSEVNGERNPNEVYIDFHDAVMKILNVPKRNSIINNPRSLQAEVEVERQESPVVSINVKPSKTANKPRKGLPPFIWVIGGPGSNKATLCGDALKTMPGWVHVSIGGLLREEASSNSIVNESVVSGEMVPQDIVMQIVEQQILLNRDTNGIILDGYPRDLNQVQEFETKFAQEPHLVLLDCSKLQLGRGRLDDSVSAFRRRLELFREMSLPMLKTLDNDNRLIIVDGDTDAPAVRQDFVNTLLELMQRSLRKEEQVPGENGKLNGAGGQYNNNSNGAKNGNGITAQGINRITNGMLSNVKQMAYQNGNANSYKNGTIVNGDAHNNNLLQNGVGHLTNGIIGNNNNRVAPAMQNNYFIRDPVRNMYNEVQENLHM